MTMAARPRAGDGSAGRRLQQGVTLFVALIFLLIFAVMAAAALNTTLTSGQAIGNMQWRNEAIAAANDAIDQVLSTDKFATETDKFTAQVNATPFRVDITGDGVDDIAVNFPEISLDRRPKKAGPQCLRYRPRLLGELKVKASGDIPCFGSSSAENPGLGNAEPGATGTVAFNSGDSICANTEWAIPVRARDAMTGTSVDVVQGVGVQVFISDAWNFCEEIGKPPTP